MPSFLSPALQAPERSFAIRNDRANTTLATHVETAFDSAARRRGLLGRTSLPAGFALILAPCNAIHTCFMRMIIDVAFVARTGRVLKVRPAMGAWRVAIAPRAFAVIELPPGTLAHSDTRRGDVLSLRASE